MTQPGDTPRRHKQALQSYLDGLLQEATEAWPAEPDPGLAMPSAPEPAPGMTLAPVAIAVAASIPAQPESAALDEFEAAVLEEQARDARPVPARPRPQLAAEPEPALRRPLAEAELPARLDAPTLWAGPSLFPQAAPEVVAQVLSAEPAPATLPPAVPKAPEVEAQAPAPSPVEPSISPGQPGGPGTPVEAGRPAWASEPFECLLFDVAGLTLAVPLVCLGSIYPLAGQTLTPLFGQPEWFLGLLPSHNGNLKVLDTARWVMPDRYRDDFQQGLQYVISVQGYEWGLAVHSVSRSLRLDPSEVKWRAQRGQRPWLAGTVIEHMCALLDVAHLAEMIASGAVKQQEAEAKAAADAKARAAAARGHKR
jgi:purine-binding chemotaxis protein CheW